MPGMFRVPGPLGGNWQPDRRVEITVTAILVEPISPQISVTPGKPLEFWQDVASDRSPPTPSERVNPVLASLPLADRGAKSGPVTKAGQERGQMDGQWGDSPPEEVLVFPPDTPTRRYRRERDWQNRDMLNRYDLIDGDWVQTRAKNLQTEEVVKVKVPADTLTARFRVKGDSILKYKLLDGNWVVTWEENLKTGAVTEITPPEASSTKGRMTEVGIRESANGKPLAPRKQYNNIIAREYAEKGYINYAEILEAGHGCMACHVTHFNNRPPKDDEIDLNRYIMWSKVLNEMNINLAFGVVTTPMFAVAEANLVMEGGGPLST